MTDCPKQYLSSALLTDLYQVTMAYGYWKQRMTEDEAIFHLTYRQQPFNSGYAIACGLENVIHFLERLRFEESDLAYLGGLTGADGQPLFERAFLDYLGDLRFSSDLDAIPEGSVVFPHEPLLRIRGPVIQCQLLETGLLNILNYQTLVATKSARICLAARGEPVLEFGLRRAHGPDGALAGSRAAYIGGCAATSNLLAGKTFQIPVRGTHAHSWVMCFQDELTAFLAFAETMPGNVVLLVDTYSSLTGVRHAIEVGRHLRTLGKELLGIRLDSGDLAYLSIEARQMLDSAGFAETRIMASNDLDEHIISSLKEQGAVINVWGVGTKLVTAFDQPALGGVFKMGAFRKKGERWQYKLKLSEQAVKVSNPGMLQVRRFERNSEYLADMIFDELSEMKDPRLIVDLADITMRKRIPTNARSRTLLVPIYRAGKLVYESPSIHEMRDFAQTELNRFYVGIKRLLNPHVYPVGLELGLHELKTGLIEHVRRETALEEEVM